MDIVLTAWALDSYLDLKHTKTFSAQEYKSMIRPDVMLLRNYPNEPKFQNSKFFSFATDGMNNRIPDGYKLKWHQVGPGLVQLRAPRDCRDRHLRLSSDDRGAGGDGGDKGRLSGDRPQPRPGRVDNAR